MRNSSAFEIKSDFNIFKIVVLREHTEFAASAMKKEKRKRSEKKTRDFLIITIILLFILTSQKISSCFVVSIEMRARIV